MPMRFAVLITLALALAGCSSAPDASPGDAYGRQRWDDQSEYRIQPAGHGFTVHVYYPLSRTQLDPRVERYLRQTALDIAQRHAEEQDETLLALEPADVRIEAVRNPFTAAMAWHATVDATFQ